jgi:nucleotide-binding universal stress UspA family protein
MRRRDSRRKDMTKTGSTGRIVVGVDGSPESALALSWAARIARSEYAGIDVVAAWEFPVNLGWTALPADFSPKQEKRRAAMAALEEAFGRDRPRDLRVITHEGTAADVLIERSATALMIIVGSRGRGPLRGLLLGSVSARVAEQARCPVLVVHAPAIPDAPDFDLATSGSAHDAEPRS